jgi:DNA-binding response OmpR family regulator
MKTVLVIDDEPDLIKLVDFHLSRDGYLVIGARDGLTGFGHAKKHQPHLILLDLMLPGMDGLETCKKLKAEPDTAGIPIIMLTAKAQEIDKVLGLELGADDYITKPFGPRELVARVKAVLRRSEVQTHTNVLKIGQLKIDYAGRAVFYAKNKLELTPTEFNLLWYLASRPGKVITRDDLISAGRGGDAIIFDRTVDVHIVSLRKKLGGCKSLIETIRGVGYKFNPDNVQET